jgi:hypothetical protein
MRDLRMNVADLEDLQTMIRRRILERTWGRVQDLRVETLDDRIVVNGSTPTSHLKQLVIEAIRESVCDSLIEGWPAIPVSLNIEVSAGTPAP